MTGWQWGEPVVAPEVAVQVCLRGDLAADKQLAEQQLVVSRRRNPLPDVGDPDAVEQLRLAERVRELEAECDAASVLFRFRGLPRRERSDLEAAHPPTEDQKAEMRELGEIARINGDTFPPALVAASCVEPTGVTPKAAQAAFESWAEGQWTPLWRACQAANFGAADPGPKSSIASDVLRGSEQS